MDLKLAQAHMATTCLLFLTGNIPKRNDKPWRAPHLSQYSADHFLDHFMEIELDFLKSRHPVMYEKLSHEVLILFKDQSSLLQWFRSVSDEQKFMCQLFSQNTCSHIRECLPLPRTDIDTDIQWLDKAKVSSEILFEPFARSVAEAWLSYSCDGATAILFLDGFMSTVSGSDSFLSNLVLAIHSYSLA